MKIKTQNRLLTGGEENRKGTAKNTETEHSNEETKDENRKTPKTTLLRWETEKTKERSCSRKIDTKIVVENRMHRMQQLRREKTAGQLWKGRNSEQKRSTMKDRKENCIQ